MLCYMFCLHFLSVLPFRIVVFAAEKVIINRSDEIFDLSISRDVVCFLNLFFMIAYDIGHSVGALRNCVIFRLDFPVVERSELSFDTAFICSTSVSCSSN